MLSGRRNWYEECVHTGIKTFYSGNSERRRERWWEPVRCAWRLKRSPGIGWGSEILQPWPSVPFYVCIFFHFNVHDMHVCVYVCLHMCETYMCGCVVTGMNSEAQG